MPRLAFLIKNVVHEISICDLGFADQWCKLKGFDAWLETPVDHGADVEPIRAIGIGDKLTLATGAIGKDRVIDRAKVQEVAPAVLDDLGNPTGTFKAASGVAEKPKGKG